MQLSTVVPASILMTIALLVSQNHAFILRDILRFLQKSMFVHNFFSDHDIQSMIINDKTVDIRYWKSELGHNNSIKIIYGQEEDLKQYWTLGLPVKIIIHGWQDSTQHGDGVFCIKTGYVKLGGYNVISVDWGVIAKNKNYMLPVLMTTKIGNLLARIIDNIAALGLINPLDVHLIGHSLGAHIAGTCGASVVSGKIGRITGLDPAGPGYEYAKFQKTGLKKSDANFVDVIHTSGGSAGCSGAMGHSDFYPNGGTTPQPGCFDEIKINKLFRFLSCSHSRSYKLYEDSMYNRFSLMGVLCDTWDDFKKNECDKNPVAPMGHDAIPELLGSYYLYTEKTKPFAIKETEETSSTIKQDL